MQGQDLAACADRLEAASRGGEWGAAREAAETLASARHSLRLGAWRVALSTAVVRCAEAAEAGGLAATRAAAAAATGARESAGGAPAATSDGAPAAEMAAGEWSRLGIASLRLLAAWLGLVAGYQRQHPSARVTAATSGLISRAVASALTLSQRTSHAAAAAERPAEHSASPAAALAGTGAGASGPEVAAAALAVLGAALELMDSSTRLAAEHAAVSVLTPLPADDASVCSSATDQKCNSSARAGDAPLSRSAWLVHLPEEASADLFWAWAQFVTHPPGAAQPTTEKSKTETETETEATQNARQETEATRKAESAAGAGAGSAQVSDTLAGAGVLLSGLLHLPYTIWTCTIWIHRTYAG